MHHNCRRAHTGEAGPKPALTRNRRPHPSALQATGTAASRSTCARRERLHSFRRGMRGGARTNVSSAPSAPRVTTRSRRGRCRVRATTRRGPVADRSRERTSPVLHHTTTPTGRRRRRLLAAVTLLAVPAVLLATPGAADAATTHDRADAAGGWLGRQLDA